MPTAHEVAAFLGRGDDPGVVALAEAHLPVVATFVRAYTRGVGFTDGEPNDELDAVILTATARLVSNPSDLRASELDANGKVSVTERRDPWGWTLIERAVLHQYRRRTA